MFYRWPKTPNNNKVMFDTNVLIYMHGFIPNEEKNKLFSPIIKHIIQENYEVYIDKVVIGEFINKYINHSLESKLVASGKIERKENSTFKFDKREHRALEEYREVLSEITNILKQILSSYNIKYINDTYKIEPEKINNTLTEMEYNDYLIANSAKKIGAILITADDDLCGLQGIDTLTAR